MAEIEHRKDPKREVVYTKPLNLIPNKIQYIQSLIKPGCSVIGVYHLDLPLEEPSYAPSGLNLLEFMATSVIKILPNEQSEEKLLENKFNKFDFSEQLCNSPIFRAQIDHRRKSGRTMQGTFLVNCLTHKTEFLAKVEAEESLPANLTTFNLNLTDKQLQDKGNVELPFMEAQKGPTGGGAVVYEFEKDDDYDEEDPYEDPF